MREQQTCLFGIFCSSDSLVLGLTDVGSALQQLRRHPRQAPDPTTPARHPAPSPPTRVDVASRALCPERRDSADTGLDSDARREFVDQLASIKKSRNVRTFAERFRLPG